MRDSVLPPLSEKSMGDRADRMVRLLLTPRGPAYANLESLLGRRDVRRVGNFFYEQGFGALILRQALLAAGSVTQTMSRVAEALTRDGCELTALLPSHCSAWENLLEDVVYSDGVAALANNMIGEAFSHNEFVSLSIDCTFRLMFALDGQVSYRAPLEVRSAQALPAGEAWHALLSARGLTGAVLDLSPLHTESAEQIVEAARCKFSVEQLAQTVHVATDDPSRKLLCALRRDMPNLAVLSLDPMHLVFVYETPHYRTGGRGEGNALWLGWLPPVDDTSLSSSGEFVSQDRQGSMPDDRFQNRLCRA